MNDTAEDELTEFELIEVESIKGVPMGANGFPHLIMKGVAKAARDCPKCGKSYGADSKAKTCEDCGGKLPDMPDDGAAGKSAGDLLDEALKAVKAVRRGKVDEAPDVELGKQILVLLGKAIENEAQEVAAGFGDEVIDVSMLTQAAEMVRMWTAGEQTAPIDGASAKGKLSAAQRDNLSDSDFAIPESRSYPIHDEAHARNALSRVAENGTAAEKSRVRAAVHKKYPDIGDDDDGKGGSKKGAVAEGETSVDTDAQDGSVVKAVADAVTKAVEPLKAEIASLQAFKAKVEKLPVPGGPVLSSNARPAGAATAEAEDFAAKAALYRAKADAAVTPADREGYRLLAREADEKAAKITA